MTKRVARPVSLAGLRGFEASARLLSFTLAAEQLHLTQSSISRQIKALEQEVGKPLFRRRVRALELTAAGQRLYRSVRPSLAEIDKTVAELRGETRRKRIMLTTITSFASLMLMPRLPAFSRLHPDIDMRIDAGDNVRDLQTEGFDLALRYGAPQRAPRDATLLLDEQLVPVLSPALAQSIGPLRKVTELARTTFLVEVNPSAADDFDPWMQWFALTGAAVPESAQRITVSYTYQALQSALDGHGVMLAPEFYVRDHLASGRLVAPFPIRLASPFALYLLVNPESRRLRHVDEFRRWLIEQFAEIAPANRRHWDAL